MSVGDADMYQGPAHLLVRPDLLGQEDPKAVEVVDFLILMLPECRWVLVLAERCWPVVPAAAPAVPTHLHLWRLTQNHRHFWWLCEM